MSEAGVRAAGSPAKDSSASVPFKVGEASPANTFLAIWVALEEGFYKKQGLDIEIVKMVGGKDSGPALEGGLIDLMHIGMSSVVRANARGAKLRTIGSLSNIIRHTLFTIPSVKTAADIKGGTVGISSAGSESDPNVTMALHRLGLKRSDVTVKEIGVQRLEALRKGAVTATLLGEPTRSMAIKEGFNPMVDLLADRTPWLYSGLVVSEAGLARNRDAILRFLRATIEGNRFAMHNPDKTKAILARHLKLADPAIIDITYENFRANTPANAELTREGARNVLDNVDVSGKGSDIGAYMDDSLMADLQREKFYEAMDRKYGPA